jgi:signal transduction histidine kinase
MTPPAEMRTALRRVATLVAQHASEEAVFAVLAEELRYALDVDDIRMARFDTLSDGRDVAVIVAGCGELTGVVDVGDRHPLSAALRTGSPVRYDEISAGSDAPTDRLSQVGVTSVVGVPITVDSRLWGAVVAAAVSGLLPPDTGDRLAEFTDLVSIAVADTEARAHADRLADEQAALRRVATLVAAGTAPTSVFEAVVAEAAHLIGAAQVGMLRFESPTEGMVVAQHGQDEGVVRVGMLLPLQGDSVSMRVLRTGRPAQIDLAHEGNGVIAEAARSTNVAATLGAPITVDGQLWGVIAASWRPGSEPRADAGERLADFAELVDSAIANADSHDQLMASRARLLSAGDEARRRVVRDLHDGAQQRLVHTIIALKLAQRALARDPDRGTELLAEALAQAEQANAELRELSHGILPSVLTRGGLRAGIDTVVSRLVIPVDLDVTGSRLAPEVEASAYFVVVEALTNVVKHAHATRVGVTAVVEDHRTLRIEVRDDGTGGADPTGSGLTGISDRVAALGGTLRIDSPPGGGTVLAAMLPLRQRRDSRR